MSTKTCWVATIDDIEETRSQACASRAAAIYWLTTQVRVEDWQACYDQLPETERDGLHRDPSLVAHEDLLHAFAGRSETSPDEWGEGEYMMIVEEQEIFSATSA